jgi:hypothetical protein
MEPPDTKRLTDGPVHIAAFLLLASPFSSSALRCYAEGKDSPAGHLSATWQPVGLSGGGGMFSPSVSPADPDLMMLDCDMSAAYISEDGGHNWRMIHHEQLRSDTRCRPAFRPTDPNVVFASSGGRLRVSRDRGRTFSPIGDLNEPLYGRSQFIPRSRT